MGFGVGYSLEECFLEVVELWNLLFVEEAGRIGEFGRVVLLEKIEYFEMVEYFELVELADHFE